jgi:hypothetical protein
MDGKITFPFVGKFWHQSSVAQGNWCWVLIEVDARATKNRH